MNHERIKTLTVTYGGEPGWDDVFTDYQALREIDDPDVLYTHVRVSRAHQEKVFAIADGSDPLMVLLNYSNPEIRDAMKNLGHPLGTLRLRYAEPERRTLLGIDWKYDGDAAFKNWEATLSYVLKPELPPKQA